MRQRLERDRNWSAYAIGDLAPGYVEHCEWHWLGPDSDALLLLYRGFTPPILFAMGSADDLRPVIREVDALNVSLHVRPDALDAMAGIYSPSATRKMRRMALPPGAFRPANDARVRATRVGPEHSNAVEALYEDGHRHGEGPTFFTTAMLRQNTFHGVWENRELIAIAGTHLYSAELGVCAIGNVYTRSDRRGRGLGGVVTSAVVAQALADAVPTIVLNVGEQNLVAQRLYERLGFSDYGRFLEGTAVRSERVSTHHRR